MTELSSDYKDERIKWLSKTRDEWMRKSIQQARELETLAAVPADGYELKPSGATLTSDDVIRLAKEAGLPMQHPDWRDAADFFAQLVEQATAESCAKLCDWQIDPEDWGHARHVAGACAKAIRARFGAG